MILARLALLTPAAFGKDGSFAFATPVFADENRIFDRDTEVYRQQLAVSARAAALPVLGAESPDVDLSDRAIWLVSVHVEVSCFPLSGYLRSGHARCSVDAEWQVVDAASGAVSFGATTQATAERLPGDPVDRLANTLLSEAAAQLYLQSPFRAAVEAVPPAPRLVPLRPCLGAAAALPDGFPLVLAAGFTSIGPNHAAGILLSPDGLGLLPASAVGRAPSVRVRLPGGLELPAQVLRRDPSLGLALVDVVGDGHRCRPPAAEINPEAAFFLTSTAGGELVLVAAPAGAAEPGALALTRNASIAGAAGLPWREVADTLGIGSGAVPGEEPGVDATERQPVLVSNTPVWTLAERRTTRGLLSATGTLAAGGLITWLAGQGGSVPLTGDPLIVVNAHMWAGALALGAVSGVQIAQAVHTQ